MTTSHRAAAFLLLAASCMPPAQAAPSLCDTVKRDIGEKAIINLDTHDMVLRVRGKV